MKAFLATTCIVTGALLAGGCATKKYVRDTTAPIQAKVDQVGEQTTQNTQQIHNTQDQVKQVDERAQSGINGANEKASTADQHASDAMNKANQADQNASQASQKADRNSQAINSLRNTVANIDDYKLQTSATVSFKFNQYRLTPETQQDLDKLVQDVQADKRFFIAVEGYTDKTGSKEYNEALSRRRADAVVEYLVAKHNIPIYRIHMVGLGEEKPLDDANNREARAKNRRVEVKVFSADQVTAALEGQSTGAASRSQQDNH
jgi:outer membrane protein OmpA-like peptidoglycan-associated protein